MQWRQFVMRLGALPAEAVEAVFARHGAEAITLSDAGDTPVLEPSPGETPLWNDVRITGLFPSATDFPALTQDLLRSLGVRELPPWHVESLEDRVWEREWLRDFRPLRFGDRLWVAPAGHAIEAPNAVIVRLDPGLAFGTGTHPTTRLCLEWLESLPLAGRRVLDFGCGSGILSIAAVLLGARSVTALDIDPQALVATRTNSERNGVSDRIGTTAESATLEGEFDVVVANILAETLKVNAGTIVARLKPGGTLGLSGILGDQAADVARAFREWIEFDRPAALESWVRLSGHRIPGKGNRLEPGQ